MKFAEFNLDARLAAGIQRAGYSQATPIQEQAIPVALSGEDIVGTAQTGTGKTAAFVLPMLHKLLQGPVTKPVPWSLPPPVSWPSKFMTASKCLAPALDCVPSPFMAA